jgi:hypothetical protein
LRNKVLVIKIVYLSLSVIALFLGVTIYASYRNTDIVLFNWIAKPGFIDALYSPASTETGIIKSMLVYNLPDGLWFLSGVLLMRSIWLPNLTYYRLYLLIFSLLAIIIEISQLKKNVSGTFDILDLIFMGLSVLMEGVVYKLFITRRISQ